MRPPSGSVTGPRALKIWNCHSSLSNRSTVNRSLLWPIFPCTISAISQSRGLFWTVLRGSPETRQQIDPDTGFAGIASMAGVVTFGDGLHDLGGKDESTIEGYTRAIKVATDLYDKLEYESAEDIDIPG